MFWHIFAKLPLLILQSVFKLFNVIVKQIPTLILFGKPEINSLQDMLVPQPYIAMGILTIILFFMFFFISLIQFTKSSTGENRAEFFSKLKKSIPAIALIFLLPVIFFLAISLLNLFEILLKMVLGGKLNVAERIYKSLCPTETIRKEWDINASGFDVLDKNAYSKLNWGEGLVAFTSIFFAVFFVLSLLFKQTLTVFIKSFEQYFLFILAPFVSATILLDNGKKFSEWKQLFLSKTFAIYSIVLVQNVFILLFIPLIDYMSQNNPLSDNSSIKFITILAIIAGSTAAGFALEQLISKMIGEDMSVKGMAPGLSKAATFATGAVAGALTSGAGLIASKGIKPLAGKAGSSVMSGLRSANTALIAKRTGASFNHVKTLQNLKRSAKLDGTWNKDRKKTYNEMTKLLGKTDNDSLKNQSQLRKNWIKQGEAKPKTATQKEKELINKNKQKKAKEKEDKTFNEAIKKISKMK
nr:hypothetical protein [Mycoplasma crocodyli]